MNFYRRRPLALAISLCLAVSAAVLLIPGAARLILALILPLVAFVTIKLLRHFGIAEICTLRTTPFVLITTALCMCLLLTSFAYYGIYAAGYEQISDGSVTAVVTDIKSYKSYGATYVVRLSEVCGRRMNGKGLIYSEDAVSLSAGDVIEADVGFVPLEDFYGVLDISRAEMLADGYLFTCRTEGDVSVVGRRSTPEVFFTRLRDSFSAKMSLYLERDSLALANALFLGDRSGLGKIYRDFYVSGIIHILALSGMHLAILTGGLEKLLRLVGIRGRLMCIPIVLLISFYVALTGFLLSVVRAAIMVLLMQLACVLNTRADPLTSLFAAVWIIVLVNPPSIMDISLQLSFFATLGVILFTEELDRRAEEAKLAANGGLLGGHTSFFAWQYSILCGCYRVCAPAAMVVLRGIFAYGDPRDATYVRCVRGTASSLSVASSVQCTGARWDLLHHWRCG